VRIFRRASHASPRRPVPNKSREAGSGVTRDVGENEGVIARVVEPEAVAPPDRVPVTVSELTPGNVALPVVPPTPATPVVALPIEAPLLSVRASVPPVPPVNAELRSVIEKPAAGVRVKLKVLLELADRVIGPAVKPPEPEPEVMDVMSMVPWAVRSLETEATVLPLIVQPVVPKLISPPRLRFEAHGVPQLTAEVINNASVMYGSLLIRRYSFM
jgi:hypothetical protein